MTDQQLNLEHLWMPFSANRDFKNAPRLMNEAKGMYYKKPDGTKVLDGTAGLWCCNAGHGNEKIVSAIQKQAAKMDYAPSFQMGHPLGFQAKSYPGDNRLILPKSSYRRQGLAPRCRLVASWG